MKPRIVILVHQGTDPKEVGRWAIQDLAGVWVQNGLQVSYLAGTQNFVPADVLMVHVDLSVVPQEYLDFAARYPVSINGRVADIRKSTISRQAVVPGDGWQGPVIVKSNLNCCALGEIMLRGRGSDAGPRAASFPFEMSRQTDYRVFETADLVPSDWFNDESLFIERFLPEREGGLYYTRSYHFLGSKETTVRLGSPNPIVLGSTATSMETLEPDPEVVRFREQMGLQYGKIDYVMHEGRVVILDVNKTTGASGMANNAKVLEMRRYRASGIYDFLQQ